MATHITIGQSRSNLSMTATTQAATTDLLQQYGEVIHRALLIRKTEQRLLELFKQGKLFGTVHTCIGQEFVGIAVARALQPQDNIFSNHRCHGHFLAYRRNLVGLIGEVMGKSVGVCGGRGGSQHLHQENFFSNGVQGSITPVSTGLAYGQKLRGTNGITVVYVGDGTLGEGVLYESMNLASKWEAPLLFVCENNLYAQSTNQSQTLAGSIRGRAEAFGIETAHSDTWRWPELLESIDESVRVVRSTGRPRFHQVDTYRLMAHSKGDDNRPESEVAPFWERDPLALLSEQYASDVRFEQMNRQIEQLIDEAVAEAEAAPFSDANLLCASAVPEAGIWEPRSFPKERVVDSVRRGLEEGLSEHGDVVLIGEDIESPYGGAFKCTMGLSARFPERVRNTPISEAAIVGVANGMALSRLKPVAEIMFGDFLALAADQWINGAAKFHWMYNGKIDVPMVVRTPMGGKRGYGPTHSQSIEKHFLGLPGTNVLCLHHRYSPAQLYHDLFATITVPTLVVENKILYTRYVNPEPPAGYSLLFTAETFPTTRLMPKQTPDLTIVAIGGMSVEAEEAMLRLFEEEELLGELFLPTMLYPFDVGVLEESLSKTRKLLVVEEGQGFVSMSSEILAQVAERFGSLNVRCRRLTASACPIPSARPLEEQCLPNTDAIVRVASELVRESIH